MSETEQQRQPMEAAPLRIAVLETGTTRPALREAYGSYPEMLIDLISGEMPGALFTSVSVVNGDSVPDAKEYDGYVIMGSRHSVHDDFPWINALKKLSQDCASRAIPQVGICFGHQLIAEALGGRVEHSANGWIAGLQTYSILGTDDDGDLVTISSLAYHQEQVAVAADSARVVLAADTCPLAGLVYEDKNAFSVQCHPEFLTAYASGLIKATIGDPLEPAFAEHALNSLATPPHRQRMARAIAIALTGNGTAAIVHALADDPAREQIDP
ncbi:MAG: type 1 glutamine amidotransferase [Woeseia sp.]